MYELFVCLLRPPWLAYCPPPVGAGGREDHCGSDIYLISPYIVPSIPYTSFHFKNKKSFAHCSYAARSSSYEIWLSEEKAMLLDFEMCTS